MSEAAALDKSTIAYDTVIPEGCPGEPWNGQADDAWLAAIGAAIASETTTAGRVGLALADDRFMRDLNQRFRGQDKPTNVLSFPTADAPIGIGDTELALGDVALGFETIQAEAIQNGLPLKNHIAHLVVHGTLHLLGHDHMQDDEASEMESLEARILARLGIADPYA